MSVLIIISVITCRVVNAQSYTTNNSLVSDNIYNTFYHYFGPTKEFKYFSYSCNYGNYTRDCYYAIDTDNNYFNIYYVSDGSYSYSQRIATGVDNNFSLSGDNYYIKKVDTDYIILVGLTFCLCLYIFRFLVLEVLT